LKLPVAVLVEPREELFGIGRLSLPAAHPLHRGLHFLLGDLSVLVGVGPQQPLAALAELFLRELAVLVFIQAGEELLGIELTRGLFAEPGQARFQFLLGDFAVLVRVGLGETLPALAKLVLAELAVVVLIEAGEDLLCVESALRPAFASLALARAALAALVLQGLAGGGALFFIQLTVAVLVESLQQLLLPALAARPLRIVLGQGGNRHPQRQECASAMPNLHRTFSKNA
jgi:hypothetical protein